MYPSLKLCRYNYFFRALLVLECLTSTLSVVNADIIVFTQKFNYTVDVFADLPASFGGELPHHGLRGYLVGANPQNACDPIDPPPTLKNYTGLWIVLIRRYDCNFLDKVREAQNANYDAAIIYNVGSNAIEQMGGADADDINITAVFVGEDDGLIMLSRYQYERGFKILITDELPFNINNYLLPFAIIVAICFFVMLIFMIVKCVKDRRRMRRYRLPSSCLKTIPTLKFKKGDPYDTCAICLEDYADGDKLRVLPCSHAYHCKCVDPWLTRNRRVCPVCKRRVLARGEQISESESENSDDETRPLLRPGSYGTQGGTFIYPPEDSQSLQENEEPLASDGAGNEEAIVHVEPSADNSSGSVCIDHLVTVDGNNDENRVEAEQETVDYCTIERELESTPTEECQEDSSVYFTPQQQQQQQQTKEHDDTLHV